MILLDTNTVIHCLKGREPAVSNFRHANPAELAIPSVVAYEIEYGSLRIASARRRDLVTKMLQHLGEVPFDRKAAVAAAHIRLDLERKGLVTGPIDLLIAGTALSLDAILATNNTSKFGRIKGLRLTDWSK